MALDDGEYHGNLTVTTEGHKFVITTDFIGAIGLYKLALGIDDEDSQQASAALQVQLAERVGP